MPNDDDLTRQAQELTLRASRLVETRLRNLRGEISTEEAMRLVALELHEVADPLALVGALAAFGAASVQLAANAANADPMDLFAHLRKAMGG